MKTLGYAVLGLLAAKPRTGYEIAKVMEVPIGYFWTASHSRIYPELLLLEEAGLLRHRVVEGPGPRDTKRYAITKKGRHVLRRWVDSPLTPQPERSELLLRVRVLWLVSTDRAVAFIQDVRLDCEQRLSTYATIEQEISAEGDEWRDPRTPAFASYATLRAGIGYERHLVAWCSWLIEQLRSGTDRDDPAAGSPSSPTPRRERTSPSGPRAPRPG